MQNKRDIAASMFNIVCAIALMMLSFAHKPPPSVPAELQFAAYILPDGKLPTLCINDLGSEKGKDKLADKGCDACRLAAAVLLPEPLAIAKLDIELVANQTVEERSFVLEHAPYPPSSGPRAPPACLFLV